MALCFPVGSWLFKTPRTMREGSCIGEGVLGCTGPGSLRPAKPEKERKGRSFLREQSKSLTQWRPPDSHTPKNAPRGLGRLGHGGPRQPPAAFPHLTHAPPHAHSQPPPQAGPPRSIPGRARPRLAPLPPTFHTQPQPPTSKASGSTSASAYLSQSSPQLRLPTTRARLTAPTPGFTPGLRLAKTHAN